MFDSRPSNESSSWQPPSDWLSARIGWSFKWVLAKSLKTLEEPFPDEALQYLIQLACVILIVGRRGSGKTALGFRLLETLRYHRWPKLR